MAMPGGLGGDGGGGNNVCFSFLHQKMLAGSYLRFRKIAKVKTKQDCFSLGGT